MEILLSVPEQAHQTSSWDLKMKLVWHKFSSCCDLLPHTCKEATLSAPTCILCTPPLGTPSSICGRLTLVQRNTAARPSQMNTFSIKYLSKHEQGLCFVNNISHNHCSQILVNYFCHETSRNNLTMRRWWLPGNNGQAAKMVMFKKNRESWPILDGG